LRISPRIFEKIQNDPNVIIRGLGQGDSWKKPEAKNLVTLSLQGAKKVSGPSKSLDFVTGSFRILELALFSDLAG
jgi:hypothetical protein